MKNFFNTKMLAKLGILLALAVIFSFIPSIPVMPGVGYIRYEFSDLPILITTFAFGVPSGLIVGVLSIVLNFALGGAESGIYGAIMHVLAISAYVIPAGLIYRVGKNIVNKITTITHELNTDIPKPDSEILNKYLHRTVSRTYAILALTAGIIAMTLIMVPANLIITTAFNGMPVSAVRALLLPAIVPANVIKGVITAVLTLILYKRISPFLHKQ